MYVISVCYNFVVECLLCSGLFEEKEREGKS